MTTETISKPNEPLDTRKPWVTPVVQKMRAGDAEAGPNPISPEGAFALGS